MKQFFWNFDKILIWRFYCDSPIILFWYAKFSNYKKMDPDIISLAESWVKLIQNMPNIPNMLHFVSFFIIMNFRISKKSQEIKSYCDLFSNSVIPGHLRKCCWKYKYYFTGLRFYVKRNSTRSITFSYTFVRILDHFCCSMQQPLTTSCKNQYGTCRCHCSVYFCLLGVLLFLVQNCSTSALDPIFGLWSNSFLFNLHGKLFIACMVYSAHRIQRPILKLRILNVVMSQSA